MSEPEHSPSGERNRAADQGRKPGSDDTELNARLERLNSSLSDVRAKAPVPEATGATDTSSRSGVALAFRLGAEFVSGVLVGAAIGYGIDRFLAISPWGLIVFTLIGFAAGVINMMRAAGEGPSRNRPKS
ncbi:AtpZ/AtpI family protein [Xanthobacter agilis]|jgi:ATP synthase protein I|uniref:ATP synthase protein I n=1 Tax=Xanthobacter agilis TaxID=47492 RepID=A0ABU0L8C1_XANAG|nr:AtpZ/AtpI family protein [Xanthobacter agilis]MDQ0503371.1 ATP synthase protein I [Xanthobacter agilis]